MAPPPVPGAPVTGTASISGTLMLDGADARPVRRATISLSGGDARIQRLAVTDDQGRFTLRGLPPGRFTVTASRLGYVAIAHGAKRPGSPGVPIALADGQHVTGIGLRMLRGAVITGRLLSPHGQPVSDSLIVLGESRLVNGVPEYSRVFAGGMGRTDDRGIFRVYGLAPGTYIVGAELAPGRIGGSSLVTSEELTWAAQQVALAARPGSPTGTRTAGPEPGPLVGYTPVFYPGAIDPAEAATVTVAAGEERSGVDFAIGFVKMARIEGTLSRADGAALPRGTSVQVFRADATSASSLSRMILPMRATPDPQGRFSMPPLSAGRYKLIARASSRTVAPPAPGAKPVPVAPVLDLWAEADVTIDGRDVTGVTLTLQPGMTISGRLTFEGTPPAPADLARVQIQLTPPFSSTGVSIGVPSIPVSEDGAFRVEGVAPGSYLVSSFQTGTAGPRWTMKSALVHGRDSQDVPFDVRAGESITDVAITFSDRVAEVTGKLTDQIGRPAPEYFVFVFPTDAKQWRQGSRWLRPPTRPASDGNYRLMYLPPGEYYMAALTDFQPTDYYNATFLADIVAAGGAVKITIGEGEKKTQDLKLSGG